MYKLKFTRLQNEIFRLLTIKSGKRLSQREISKLLEVSPTAIAKALPVLEKEGLVHVDKSMDFNLNYISLNRDSEKAISLKRVENLKLIYESGLQKLLEENFPGCAVILFGSYSLGEDTVESDVDIAVVGSKKKNVDTEKIDKLLERNIYLHFYGSFKEMKNNLKSNILSGIVLSGTVEL